MANEHAPRFTVKVGGPAVGPGRLAARDVAEIARRLEQALKRIGQVLYGEESRGKRRKPRDIEQLCGLYLVSWKAGSAIVGFELAEPPPQLSLFGYVGENSLKAFLEGLAGLSEEEPAEAQFPAGFDTGVLESCESLAAVFDRGIDTLTFSSPGLDPARTVIFTPSTRQRVRSLLRGPLEPGRVSKVGRLDVLNGHAGLAGGLWEPDGTRWQCSFKPEHVDVLPEAWLKTVTLVGEATRDGILKVETIRVHGAQSAIPGVEEAPFWQPTPLEDLADRQDVAPVDDLDELTALWPEDEAFDDALGELLRDRSVRRQARKSEAG